MALPFFSSQGVSAAQRRAEASRTFEDVLLEEHRALFETAEVARTPSTIEPGDIDDLQRIAEYLYEASVKDLYGEYVVSAGADGPRLALRAKIWRTLPEPLRNRLEQIATHPSRESIADDQTARALAEALNAIIVGEHLTGLAEQRV